MRQLFLTLQVLWLVSLALQAGCGPISEDDLNKWMNTERGPAKISETLRDGAVKPGLRAVAARNLVRLEKAQEAVTYL